MPRTSRILAAFTVLGVRVLKIRAPMTIALTRSAWPIIHKTKGRRPRRNRSSSRLCAGSLIAPKIAMIIAPAQTSMVPVSESRVNGSPRIRVAQIELKTSPDFLGG